MGRHCIRGLLRLSLGMMACSAEREWDGSFEQPDSEAANPEPSGSTGAEDDGGSDESSGGTDGDSTAEYVEEAKREFPTYLDLHQKVIVRTCTPDEGVCHNKKEYPDLHTPQTMLGVLGSPCNLDVEDPLDVYNGCEPPGDILRFMDGNNALFESEVAWVDLLEDEDGNLVGAEIVLRDPVPGAMSDPATQETVAFFRSTSNGMLSVGQLQGAVSYLPGTDVVLVDTALLGEPAKTLLEVGLQQGDLNRDGVFGASEEPYRMLVPGNPWTSYLLQRLQGNVPGSPMPLANQPLTSAEIIAIACWIEGTATAGGDSPHAEIDYDDCAYAEDFGEPPADSGATFSGHVQPLFDQRCAAAQCHGAQAPAAGLSLVEGVARENLLRPSTQNPEVGLVTPGNPTNSYLVTKLTGNGITGVQMPIGGTLSEEEIEMVRLWISYGAPND